MVREELGLGKRIMPRFTGSESLPLPPTVCCEGPVGEWLGPRTCMGFTPTMASIELSQSTAFRHGCYISFG